MVAGSQLGEVQAARLDVGSFALPPALFRGVKAPNANWSERPESITGRYISGDCARHVVVCNIIVCNIIVFCGHTGEKEPAATVCRAEHSRRSRAYRDVEWRERAKVRGCKW